MLNRVPSPVAVDALELMLSLRCDLACSYCRRHDQAEEMSGATARAALDLLFARPAERKDLTFTGGEPLLRRERVEGLSDEARGRARRLGARLRLNVLTNGAGLTPAALDFLSADDVRAVVTAAGEPASHDRFRRGPDGRGSWARVARGLDALVARLPPERLLVTVPVHPELARRLRDDVRFLMARGVRNLNLCAVFGVPWTAAQAADLAREYAGVLADAVAAARAGAPVAIQALGASLKRWTGTTPHYDYRDEGGTHCPLAFRLVAWPDGVLSLNPFRFGPEAADFAVGRLGEGFRAPFGACAPDGSACPACRKRVVGVDRAYGAAYMAAAGGGEAEFRRAWRANVLLCDGALNRAAADRVWRRAAQEPALKRFVEVNDSCCDLVG
ncbi:MAG: radical SAM protein [Elusimicrobia bacterium]|nr:radical SAM protein [Elusimicrobiota bacterium]